MFLFFDLFFRGKDFLEFVGAGAIHFLCCLVPAIVLMGILFCFVIAAQNKDREKGEEKWK